METSARIAILGTGYVGTATAIGLSHLGCRVVGYDVDAARAAGLAAGNPPYHEAGFARHLGAELASARLRFTSDLADALADAELIAIAVGTPPRPDGSADLSQLDAAIASIARSATRARTIVVRSTIPPGTCELLARALGDRFRLAYAPEFLREGNAIEDFLHPDRTVVGTDSEEAARDYLRVIERLNVPVVVTSLREAELIKNCANAFLALKVSYANEIANLCGSLGADALRVLHAVGLDHRIGTSCLAPGIGFGGPCFDKDVRSLVHVAEAAGTPSALLDATLRVNELQPRRIADMLVEELGTVAGARIGVWGLTFKAGTDDVRNSLAVTVIEDLVARGARVTVFDPAARNWRASLAVQHAPTALDAAHADALAILTEWPEFAQVDLDAVAAHLRRGLIVDGRNILDPAAVAARGLRYRGVGRTAQPAAGIEARAAAPRR